MRLKQNGEKKIVGTIVSAFLLIAIIFYAILTQYNIEDNQVRKCSINQKEEISERNKKEGTEDNGWKVELDLFENCVLGSNLFYNGWCTEGNGYIYTTNMAFYGETQEDDSISTIYRFDKSKNQWEIVVSYAMPQEEHLYDESGGIINDRYVWDLTYYRGYVYYILVNDYAPGEGIGKEYYFYRASERNGKVEKIGEGFDKFHI